MAVEVPTKLQCGGLNDNKLISGTMSPRKKSSPTLPSSPYISNKNIDLLSRMTEKRCMQKKTKKSSIQNLQIEQVYKVNSHQFTKTSNKKQNKSVLTLPHKQAPIPNPCTVSDMTESEYLGDGERLKQKAKRTVYSKRSKPIRNKGNDYVDFTNCCSSIETIKLGKKGKGKLSPKVTIGKEINNDFSNIWSAVRSMNKLQFQNSPNISFESDVTTKHMKINTFNNRRKKLRNNNRVYESYESEELLCFTLDNIPNNNKTLTASQNSSTDKIAIIREIDTFCSKPNSGKKSSQKKIVIKNKIENIAKSITNKRSNQASLCKKKPMDTSLRRNFFTDDFSDTDSFDSSGYIKNRLNNSILPLKSEKSKINVGLPASINLIHPVDSGPTKFSSNIKVNGNRDNSIHIKRRGIKTPQKVLSKNDDHLFLINKSKKDQKHISNSEILKNKQKVSNISDNQYFDTKKKDKFYDCLDIFVDSQSKDLTKSVNNIKKSTRLKRQRCRSPTIIEEIEDSVQGGIHSECNKGTKYRKFFEPNKEEQTYIQMQHNLPGCTIKLRYDNNAATGNNNKKYLNRRSSFIETKVFEKNKVFFKQAPINERTSFKFPEKVTDKKVQSKSSLHIKEDPKIISAKTSPRPHNIINTEDFQKCKDPNSYVRNKTSKKKKKYVRHYNLDTKESSHSIKTPKVMICKKDKHNDVDTSIVLNQKNILPDEFNYKKTKQEELRTFDYLKEKMVNILAMNGSQILNDNDDAMTTKQQELYKSNDKTKKPFLDNTVQQVNVRTSTSFTLLCCTKTYPDEVTKHDNGILENNNYKAIWSKRKWASDFIDHVIMKLKNGFYYTHENQKKVSTEDVSVQTRLTFDREKLEKINKMQLQEKTHKKDKLSKYVDMVVQQYNDPLKSLLGWDNVLAKLEVEIPNINQIEIKHCKPNVVVRFDVTMVSDRKTSNVPCIEFFTPCANTNSQTQVFKYKTIIVNRMVPASICSLIPMLIKNIIRTNNTTELHNSKVISALPVEQKTTSQAEAPKLIGKYSDILKPKAIVLSNNISEYHSQLSDCIELLPKPTKTFVTNDYSDLRYWDYKRNGKQISSQPLPASMVVTGDEICATTSNFVQPSIEISDCNFQAVIANTMRNVTIRKLFSELHTNYIKSETNVHFRISISNQDIMKIITVDMNKGFFDKTFKAIISLTGDAKTKPGNLAAIEYKDTKSICHCKKKRKVYTKKHHRYSLAFHKVKSRNKLEKCKSNISENTSKSNISLNDINTLQDFFNVFVNDEMLATIIDSATENKIMNCLSELKNLITEITPVQAFLIFLLANKNETISLLRLRAIMKAIAVKKITNSHELDMEIQVVDKEILGSDIQDEETALAKHKETNKGLLEELYLIAKTTAADFNKPFDVSPETLLSSLLAKRKTLNPSYLRVMARYVGLGLMKLPKTP